MAPGPAQLFAAPVKHTYSVLETKAELPLELAGSGLTGDDAKRAHSRTEAAWSRMVHDVPGIDAYLNAPGLVDPKRLAGARIQIPPSEVVQ